MGRMKIPMQHINDFKKRKLTFETRKNGMFKKAFELSTLCDVNVSMIVYTDDQENPEIFPQDSQKLNSLIDLYKKNRSSDCGRSKSFDLSGFFKDRNVKIERELADAKKKNVVGKYPTWFDYLNDFSEKELKEFGLQLDDKIDFVKNRLESIKNGSEIQNLDQGSSNGNVVTANVPFKSTTSEDDNGLNGNDVSIRSSSPNFVNADSKMMIFGDDDKIWYQDDPFLLPSSPERAQQFCEQWFSSTSDGDGLLYGF